jgi:hypothetical protein
VIRNRRFESSSLQQGVFEPSVPPHATDLIRLRGTFQIASGIFLAAYLLGHMMNCAFVFARLYLGIDSDWALATAASGLVKVRLGYSSDDLRVAMAPPLRRWSA